MTAFLLDTHAWVWSLAAERRLSPGAREAIERAEAVFVSPITFYEITRKVRLGKWPAMEPHVAGLPALLEKQGAATAPLDATVCTLAGTMEWDHRDPFDRLLAATALHYGLAIVSADAAFDSVVSRRW